MELGEQILREVSQKSRSESKICERCRKNQGQRAKSAIGVAKIDLGEQILREVSQKSRLESKICERCCKNGALRANYARGVAKIELR